MIVLFPYGGGTIGGSHVSSLNLVRNLEASNEIKPVVAVQRDGNLSRYLTRQRIPFRLFPKTISGRHHGLITAIVDGVVSAPRLSTWLRSQSVDIVHTNDLRMHLLWSVACRLSGVKHVLHSRSPRRGSKSFNLLASMAHQVVTVTDFCRSLLGSSLSPKVLMIPNPIEPSLKAQSNSQSREQLLETKGIPKQKFIVGWSANFLERKRPQDFIRLASELPEPISSETIFVLFGDHSSVFGKKIEAQIAVHPLRERIFLLGWDDAFADLVGGLDLLVVTSERESFGRTSVEAIIAGTPVIASDIGPHVEVLRGGQFGQLFRTRDVGNLSLLVAKHLMDPKELQGRASEGAIVLTDYHSPKKHSERLISLYRRLL